MSDEILGKATYKCLKCNAKHYINPEDLLFEAESGSERGMGAETQYVAELDEPCHQCNNDIFLKFEVWEYPVGIINFTNENASGANILESEFWINHKPDEESYKDAIKLITPLLSFRFDKFSELFVDFWISSYKKAPKPTTIISIVAAIATFASAGLSIYQSEKNRTDNSIRTQNYTNQFNILKETEKNLNDLSNFISSKKSEIEATQQLITSLERKKSELEPIVNAHQKVINAIFLQQKKEAEKSLWVERVVSFGLGILASLIASLIWHFTVRFRESKKV